MIGGSMEPRQFKVRQEKLNKPFIFINAVKPFNFYIPD